MRSGRPGRPPERTGSRGHGGKTAAEAAPPPENRVMGKTYARIEGRLRAFIEEQKIFFTATAPLSGDGCVNLSPKALDGSFALLDDHTFAYADLGGSGAETVAHLRENGRITLMWCAFT